MRAALYARVSTNDQTCENQLLEFPTHRRRGVLTVGSLRPEPPAPRECDRGPSLVGAPCRTRSPVRRAERGER